MRLYLEGIYMSTSAPGGSLAERVQGLREKVPRLRRLWAGYCNTVDFGFQCGFRNSERLEQLNLSPILAKTDDEARSLAKALVLGGSF